MREDIVNSVINQYNTKKENQIDNNPAVSNNQKVEKEQKGFTGAMQKMVDAFENSIIGKAFLAPSKIMQNTFNKLQESDGSVLGDIGVALKGGAEASGTMLRTAGNIMKESWTDIGKAADTEIGKKILGSGGSALIKAGTTGAGLASEAFVNSLMFSNPVVNNIDKIIDITKLTGDILALTDGKTSGKELIQDAIYTTLDFTPEITNAIKSKKAVKVVKDANGNIIDDITKKRTSLKADDIKQQDAIDISNKASKKFTSALTTTETPEEFITTLGEDWKNSKEAFENTLINADPKKVFNGETTDTFKEYLNNYSNTTKAYVKDNTGFVNGIHKTIDDIVKNPNKSMLQINDYVNELNEQIKNSKELSKAEKKIYEATSSYLQSKYTEDIKRTLDDFRVNDALIDEVDNLFKTTDKKEVNKKISNLSKNLFQRLSDNVYVGITGGKPGIYPSKNATADALVNTFSKNKKATDRLYKNLQKSAFKSLPKETKDDIITNINKTIEDILRNSPVSPRGVIESTYDSNINIQEQSNYSQGSYSNTYTTPYKSDYQEYLDSLYY